MKGVVIGAVFMVLAMISFMVKPNETMSCSNVQMCLIKCVPYLIGAETEPAPGCCDGVKALKNSAVTTADKLQVCGCIKQAATIYPGLKDEAISLLPVKCGAPLSFPISKNMDCNSIKASGGK